MNKSQQIPSIGYELNVQHFSIGSHWLYEGQCRFDSTSYAEGAFRALNAIETCRYPKGFLRDYVSRIYHPTESQPRSNFKRIWVKKGEGPPFLTTRQLFFFRPPRSKFVSGKMPKLPELMPIPGSILLSRSGTTGHPVMVGRWLSQFAVSDDALRIYPDSLQIGYIYAFLASSYGYTLMTKSEYGSTVSHLEAKHISNIPIPIPDYSVRESIHNKILNAYELRDEANELLDQADEQLHDLLELSPFTEDDIEYLGDHDMPRAFSVSSNDLQGRLDATNHVPLVRSVIHKLEKARFSLTSLNMVCSTIYIPARFKRNYVVVDKGVPYLLPSQLPTVRMYGLKALSQHQAQQSPEYLLKKDTLLITTDGTVGVVHPVTTRMVGWFGSNNMARLWDEQTDMGFLYTFLSTPYGVYQIRKDIYGGVVDHINESHIGCVKIPAVPIPLQKPIGDLVRQAFNNKDTANKLEDEAITEVESLIENE